MMANRIRLTIGLLQGRSKHVYISERRRLVNGCHKQRLHFHSFHDAPYGLGQQMRITTVRLCLRELQAGDLCSLAGTINNPRITRNLTRVPWPYDLNDAQRFYEHTLTLPPQSAVYVITDRSNTDRLLGVISYEGVADPELGYWLDEPFWGKGIITEAARSVLRHAFIVTKVQRLLSRCILGNEPSRRILVGLGFRPVNIGSVYSIARGRAVISQNFELTSKEWRYTTITETRD
jgi:RimJ/RimL family protein N-acetyltransferase